MTFFQVKWTIYSPLVSSFVMGPCIKNYCIRFIFDRVIPKNKNGDVFLGQIIVLSRIGWIARGNQQQRCCPLKGAGCCALF